MLKSSLCLLLLWTYLLPFVKNCDSIFKIGVFAYVWGCIKGLLYDTEEII